MSTNTNMLNTYNDMANKSVDQMNALGELNLKIAEKMVARQMDMMNMFVEQSVRMMKLATEAKGYNEYYKGQVEMTKDIADKMMSESKANMHMAGEIRDEYRGWFDGAMSEMKNNSATIRNAVTA
ncbi:phasin family protein [Thiohalocapsa marina]|uniref:Phasin family protein n=1 Tax=Thiohalocapsa marina TaxID=424902 RepID=A0A5M8FU79_9GAMM|nr:phasin family protein [Thiohalocapsa marina]KAA6187378.1 phasin family protein [Thiohalocapsa marina]